MVVGLLLWTTFGQVAWAGIAYPPPLPVWPAGTAPPDSLNQLAPPAESLTSAGLKLRAVETSIPTAGRSLKVTLWWQALAAITEDYLLELTLLDEAGNIASYTLGQPVQGRYPTRAWEPGDLVKDVHWLPLIGSFNGNYRLQLRLLDHAGHPVAGAVPVALGSSPIQLELPPPDDCAIWSQGQPGEPGYLAQPYRLRSTFTVVGPNAPTLQPQPALVGLPVQQPFVSVNDFHIFMVGPEWAESYQLVVDARLCGPISVEVPPRNFTIPDIANPMEVTFNNEVRLLGYDLPARRIDPGERLPLTLYWQALDYMGHDYRIFDNLLDASQRRWGGYDRRARDGYSTLLWAPGEVVSDAFGVPVDQAAPAGIYTLDIGLYQAIESSAVALPLTIAGQAVDQRSIRLGPIKVGGPPPDVVVTDPSPQVKLNQPFGQQITLLGYDLARPTQNSKLNPQNLDLTLYWRAEDIPETDFTTFVHLRNSANQNAAQKDSPPAEGRYPTSLWDAGEVIADRISLSLAGLPPGDYTPVVGLYNPISGARLPIRGLPENELRLESVTLP